MSLAYVFILVKMRHTLASTWLAILEVCFLSAFVIIRAAGFYHFDVLIGQRFLDMRVNWILELTGIGLGSGPINKSRH